ncbi:DegT/DnrJ/EryC1/StrS family aminotransferase [Streptomyces sp. NBC_01142]|uniref:DegT/DnrJ/EryC1/StrS family aminotransferase n=1 Tax=Streptomyces sp. NBC_01142 TaxID=2975865 RepID=UPI0022564D81|nr:DegT/DnrJ/EryC1/StrS family aminotransferase [Streptomyces sp. NBC_01142]MCX4824580.1 DegT/DnrJ/EryC1/StrS family aminotransferase [Streptomyces sp. NBC_01142]
MTASEPLVSILMPCYNRPYLMTHRSIPSVLEQTYRNWELIVVSDGLDNHAVRAAACGTGDSRIRYAEIPRPDYSGLGPTGRWFIAGAAARNRAEDLAEGEIIALLDDDDAFLPNHLADCVRMLTETGADLAYGLVRLHDVNSGTDSDYYHPWDAPGTLDSFLTENVLYTPSVAYRAKWKQPPYPTDGKRAADHGKWLAMHRAGARFVGTASAQAVYYGDSFDGVLRLSPPPKAIAADPGTAHGGHGAARRPLPRTTELESALARYLGVPETVAVPDGDTGLGLVLRVLRDRCPDRTEVVIPSYAPPSTAEAVVRSGLTPVFCDVDAGTLTVTASTAEPVTTRGTLALLPVHVHGIPCDMSELRELADAHGAFLIGDARTALGSATGGVRTGSVGDAEVFGFGPGTPLGCGAGGVIGLRDPEWAAALRRLVRRGADGAHQDPDSPGCLPESDAAQVLAGLPLLDAEVSARRRSVALYGELLADVPGLQLVGPRSGASAPAWAEVPLMAASASLAERLTRRLADHRIESGTYHRPLHLSAPYARFAAQPLPVAAATAGRMVGVPVSGVIPDTSVALVVGVARETLSAAAAARPAGKGVQV